MQTFSPEELKTEVWKPVPGYEKYYSVSNLGRVKSHRRNVILRAAPNKNNYIQVALCVQYEMKTFTVHKLVTLAFLGTRPEGKEVNHIDLDRSNCRLSNLEYLTHQENVKHSGRLGRMGRFGDKHGTRTKPESVRRGTDVHTAKLTESDVIEIRRIWANRSLFAKRITKSLLSRKYNVSNTLIGNIIRRETWKHI